MRVNTSTLSGAAGATHSGTGFDPARMVEISEFLARLPVRIDNLTANSREAQQGTAFLAYPGHAHDGRDYIADAIAHGTSAVLWERQRGVPPRGVPPFSWRAEWRVPNLAVADLKAQASAIAGQVFGHPAEQLWMVGITGTNGKTSVSQWVAQALQAMGRPAGIIGTLGNGPVGRLTASANTTPDAIVLQRLLRDFLRQGLSVCAMEVSSHGLEQERVAGLKYDVAVFTNLTRDHLDYHGTMENYGAAKARLFDAPGLKTAVINVDDAFGRSLAVRVAARGVTVIPFARINSGGADLIATDIAITAGGLRFRVTGKYGEAIVESDILGAFNVSNLLAVIGVLLASGVSLNEAARRASELRPVPGRMQTARQTGKPLVVVDYAHTPDALEKALTTLAAIIPESGKLISVFGCGGDRDRGKRPQMAAVSARFADFTLLTSDNPRSENPQHILADIEAGMEARGGGHAPYRCIVDRRAAIFAALEMATPADIVLIAGKGHEDYQIMGDVRHHFSDAEVAHEALAQWQGGSP